MFIVSPSHRLTVSFLWGLFCACSWTWCIGMYLPRLMIERFGWWGFIAFAVPNVVGCTAFGYVVNNRARSEAMIARQRGAMPAFSSLTIAYHLFFLVWLFDSVVPFNDGGHIAPLACALVVLCLSGVFSFLPNRDWLGLSVLVYAVSILAFVNVGFDGLRSAPATGEMNLARLWWIAPFLLFGFMLCPYLDLTFHRAIQNSPSRHAFLVFGAAFSVMILLSAAIWFYPPFMQSGWLPAIVIAHVLAQTIFTVAAHLREIRVTVALRSGTARAFATFLPLLAVPLLSLARTWRDSPDLGETLYIAFLSLYGTMFPAWFVWRSIRRRAA